MAALAELWHFGTVRNTPFLRLVLQIPHSAAKEGRKTPGAFGKGQRALGQLRLSSPSLLDHFAFEAFHDLFFEAGYVGLGEAKEGGYFFLGHFLAVGGVEAEP